MVWWLAAAHAVEIGDIEDALYLERTNRAEEAATWLLDHRDDDPTSARTLYAWLRIVGWESHLRTPALLTQVRRWSDAHPKAEDAPVAIAAATAWAALDAEDGSSLYPTPGPWCEDARKVLGVAPQSGAARYRILYEQTLVERRCGGPIEPIEAAMRELALSGDAGIGPLAWWSVDDGVDEADVDLLRRALDDDPTRLDDYRKLAKPVEEGEEPGVGREAARELLLERARAAVADPRPSRVAAAIIVLDAAGSTDETRAARSRLAELDPENRDNAWSLDRPAKPAEGVEEPEIVADTMLDPAARLAALREQGPPIGDWSRRVYWQARADSAAALGDAEEEYRSLERLGETDVRLVRSALLTGRLRQADRLADRLVGFTDDAPGYRLPADGRPDDDWKTERAEALDVRATVLATRGRSREAADDLEEAMALAPTNPDQLLRLGLLYADLDRDAEAAPLIGAGLVALAADDPRHDRAMAVLGECLATSKGWAPTVDDWLDAMRERQARLAAPAEESDLPWDDGRFTDLVMAIDGQEQRLFDVPGPIVLDLWATWCGPCTKSLPHLDQLARTWDGRVTFIAVSVDAEEEAATRYLDRRGGTSFRRAWLGADGMAEMGVDGIPAMFVFDAEHRLVARLLGWGPGNTDLDEAIERALAR